MLVHTRLESAHLAGNLLEDPSERDLFVYLPPGHEESGRRCPETGNHGGRANERYQVALHWLSSVLDGD